MVYLGLYVLFVFAVVAQFGSADFGFAHLSVDLVEERFAHAVNVLADANDGHCFLHDPAEEVLVDLQCVIEAVGLGGEEIILYDDFCGQEFFCILLRVNRQAHLAGDISSGVYLFLGDFHSNFHDNFSFLYF